MTSEQLETVAARTVLDDMRQSNALVQIYSNEWPGQRSLNVKTQKKHVQPMFTSEELNQKAHPLFSMGGKRHFEEKFCNPKTWRPHMKSVPQTQEHWTDKTMQKIIENYPILKPKVERINGQEDFMKLVNGNVILQKYGGVKQLIAREKVEQKRQEERLKRTFIDSGIQVMTVDGEKTFTINGAQDLKRQMNEEKRMR